jgi:hypothetical protein
MTKKKQSDDVLQAVPPLGEDVVLVNNFDGTASIWSRKEITKAIKTCREHTPAAAIPILVDIFAKTPNRVFQVREQDLKMLKQLKRVDAGGGYFYGTLKDGNKKFAHHIALKEVAQSNLAESLSSPLAMSISAGLGRIEHKLEQIASVLTDVKVTVVVIEKLLRRKFGADALTSVQIVSNIYENFLRNEVVDEIDSDRLIAIEHILKSNYVQIVEEISEVHSSLNLTEHFSDDVEALLKNENRFDADNWNHLLQIEALLRNSCLQHLKMFQHLKLSSSTFDPIQIEHVRNEFFDLSSRVDRTIQAINDDFVNYDVPKCPNELFSLLIGGKPQVNRRAKESRQLSELKEIMIVSTDRRIKQLGPVLPKLKFVAA